MYLIPTRASLVKNQLVKNLPAVQETLFQFLGLEDPLEKALATHSSILAGEAHGQRSQAGYSPWGDKQLNSNERLSTAQQSLQVS